MKKIRISFCILLLALTVAGLAGCSNNKDKGQGSTGGSTTQTETSSGAQSGGASGESSSGVTNSTGGSGEAGSGKSGSGTNGSGTNGSGGSAGEESSTGVIDGLMDDVERGVEDLTGETGSGAADESR